MLVDVHRQRGKSDMGRAALSLWKQDIAAGLALALYVLMLYLLAGAWVDLAPIANAIWQPERVPIFGLPTSCQESSPGSQASIWLMRNLFGDAISKALRPFDVAPNYLDRLTCLYDNDWIGNTE